MSACRAATLPPRVWQAEADRGTIEPPGASDEDVEEDSHVQP